ncbi:MAG: energy-coupling factor transporter ATPase [Bacilli bacterium]|jgi:energy-coupling factor transport system ATP-binding protein|nr:energy-coupling factor transporter ATPase [Bacilli bacterium]
MIEIKDLYFSYDNNDNTKKWTLENINLKIKKGSHTVILGHNGSGKSTIAKLIIGLLEAKKGTIMVDGLLMNEESVYDIRDKVGIVFQNPDNQFIGASVQDDIAFGLENKCVPSNEMMPIVKEYAQKVGMEEYLNHEPSRLSGGQKQRVALAGILAMHPDIMIFDEATSMLDPTGVNEINHLIDVLQERKEVTIISITHDIDYVLKADYVIVLEKGKIIMEGLPKDIFKEAKKLSAIGLDIPLALKISNSLQEKGIEIDDYLSMKELEDKLCQLI